MFERNAIKRRASSSRLDNVTGAAIAGRSCGVRSVQVRLERVRLTEWGEM